jgi:hypothetical protein
LLGFQDLYYSTFSFYYLKKKSNKNRLAVLGVARAVMSDFEIGELPDIYLFSGILKIP